MQVDQISAYRWLMAWFVFILMMTFIAKLKVGYILIYYLAVLTLLFIILTQYKAITSLLAPFTQLNQAGGGK